MLLVPLYTGDIYGSQVVPACSGWTTLMGGTLTLWPGLIPVLSTLACELERFRGSVLVFCTLLGPEGPAGTAFSVVLPTSGPCCVWFARRTGYRPYFENYTVDASILDTHESVCHKQIRALSSPGYSCDINFLRADGGCLGIWSRRRTYKSAISLGELIIEL